MTEPCHQCGRAESEPAKKRFRGNSYCQSCFQSKCSLCNAWAVGMQKLAGCWECPACNSLSEDGRKRLCQLHRVLERASFHPSLLRGSDTLPRQPGEINAWLCIGDIGDAMALLEGKLEDRGITTVVTLCKNHLLPDYRGMTLESFENAFQEAGIKLLVLDARDSASYDMLGTGGVLAAVTAIAQEVKTTGGKLLVHCFGGVNRASVTCIALLMLLERLPLLEAAEAVVARRGAVLGNLAFRRQLVKLASEHDLLGDGKLCASFVEHHGFSVAPASWTTEDGSRLLQLVQLAIRSGLGEKQRDRQNFTLQEWEEWNGPKSEK
eukprot:TRINITY_DN111756_c0_g1_i1.p1 TRINITY_DN111756_c0_g1~~TRINITY_DN111756_c0_g1_i1.p1  ORF type:complete len:322 (-),score=56.53 TRINITY_DN111756_c0_g1_i1:4-969(-)